MVTFAYLKSAVIAYILSQQFGSKPNVPAGIHCALTRVFTVNNA